MTLLFVEPLKTLNIKRLTPAHALIVGSPSRFSSCANDPEGGSGEGFKSEKSSGKDETLFPGLRDARERTIISPTPWILELILGLLLSVT